MHSYMVGKVIVMPPQEFAAWYDGEAAKLAPPPAAVPAPKKTRKSV
jgi:heme/copper-type cytochrome/quinol oxidase subunit 2